VSEGSVSNTFEPADNISDGDQSFFPVYEPDPEAIRAKYRAAEEEARAHHYDSTKEGTIRTLPVTLSDEPV